MGNYANEYTKAHYDTIRAIIPKGKLKEIKLYAVEHGVSVSQLVIQALEKVYGFDLSHQNGKQG